LYGVTVTYSGARAAAGGPSTILRFCEPDLLTIVYLEQLTSASYLDKVEDDQHFLRVTDRWVVQAESSTDTITLSGPHSKKSNEASPRTAEAGGWVGG
jgi:hypothetical protein